MQLRLPQLNVDRRLWLAAGAVALVVIVIVLLIGGGGDEGTKEAEADVIFVGEVLEVGEPPLVWSGRVEARQSVRYRVLSVTKGELEPGDEVTVLHLVVEGSTTARSDMPGLSTNLFKIGNSLEVHAKEGSDPSTGEPALLDFDEEAGTVSRPGDS
jgi:hypothetical protein